MATNTSSAPAVPQNLLPQQGAVSTPAVQPQAGPMSAANAPVSAAPAAGQQVGATPLGGTPPAKAAVAPVTPAKPGSATGAVAAAKTPAQQAQDALAAKNDADAKAAAQGGLTDAQVAEKKAAMLAQVALQAPVPKVPIKTDDAKAAVDAAAKAGTASDGAEYGAADTATGAAIKAAQDSMAGHETPDYVNMGNALIATFSQAMQSITAEMGDANSIFDNAKQVADDAYSAQTEGIHADAAQEADAQAQANDEVMAKTRGALAVAGIGGTGTALSILAGVQQGNDRALMNIKLDETKAIGEAAAAHEQGDLDIALKKLDEADNLRTSYADLAQKQFETGTAMQTMQQQQQAFEQQTRLDALNLQKEGKNAVTDYLSMFAKQGIPAGAIPDDVWQQAANASQGIVTAQGAKLMYQGTLNDQQAENATAFAANSKNFYQLASQIPEGTDMALMRPNPDGSFSKVTFKGGRFLYENGQSYRLVTDESDPNGTPVKIPLGSYAPNVTLKDDGWGGTVAVSVNPDGTVTQTAVVDTAGNDKTSGALASTSNAMSDAGSNMNTSSNPVASSMYPDGSVHDRNGKPAPECGEFCNDAAGTSFGDSLQDKESKTDKTIGYGSGQSAPKVGDVVVTDENPKYGHVAIINSVSKNSDGTYSYTLTESNFQKNDKGQGTVTNDRKMRSDSDSIKGYAHPGKDPFPGQADTGMPDDNSAAWGIPVAEGGEIKPAAITDGTVTDISPYKASDGSMLFKVTVKDEANGVLGVFSGVNDTNLRVGSKVNPSTTIGTAGRGESASYQLRNGDGSPVMPKNSTSDRTDATTLQWGTRISQPTNAQAVSTLTTITTNLSKGVYDLNTALNRAHANPYLSQMSLQTLTDIFAEPASDGNQAKKTKELQQQRTQQSIDSMKMMEVNRALTAIPTYQFDKTKGVIAQEALAEVTKNRADAARTSGSDFELLDALTSFVNSGGKITEGQMALLQANQTPWDKLSVLKDQAMGNRVVLSDGQRQQLFSLIDENLKNTKSSYDSRMAMYQTYLDKNGIDFQLSNLDATELQMKTAQGSTDIASSDIPYLISKLQPGEQLYKDSSGQPIAADPSVDDVSGYTLVQ